jgi:hypothetical protein
MELKGKWTKDEDGYMTFDDNQLQRYYEAITEQYFKVYDRYLEEHDEEYANLKAREMGYKMITDYKTIDDKEEFATSYATPNYEMDLWYESDPITGKRDYNKGYLRIRGK